ncbi:ubiquinone biosynthesis O-methyltransferase [Sistotremastrum niveocremeum HHB9708]|uniref:Ubiquinone biosynthesis O-methyltransferase, mitochondrial n=1 Tax=Sistotremastrum niveocremeum HHB9708 TaxID=1314777 RepID=A0A164VPN5_9AGAM|nr:ubiquinone biosynthesis O-methyltransferase [Sistotremastrum niveocremeum HHB9708]
MRTVTRIALGTTRSVRGRCSPAMAIARMNHTSSINPDEIAHFSRLSASWWDEQGEFGLLHKMNPVRMQFIRDKLLEISHEEDAENVRNGGILEGKDALDVGCGGGLLSESLARLGARTLGVDASLSNINIASLHASSDHWLNGLEYRHMPAEDLVKAGRQFDIVCSMEVIEHVDNPANFLRSLAHLVKPGGHLFMSTIARTPLSYFLTIFMAERALRLVTPGTHTYSKFINPSELLELFQEDLGWLSRSYHGTPPRTEAEIQGIAYLPWKGAWALLPKTTPGSMECNYMFWARKPLQDDGKHTT